MRGNSAPATPICRCRKTTSPHAASTPSSASWRNISTGIAGGRGKPNDRDDVTALARRAGRALKKRGLDLVTAESCTGGGIATACTRISGSAKWFERGMVTYTNVAKQEMLGVKPKTLKRHGAVSEEVAREMAAGALKR